MVAITFDTLKYANTLKEAGVPPAQAKAEATALSDVLEVNLNEWVTKENLLLTRDDLRRDINDLRRDMEVRFSQVDSACPTGATPHHQAWYANGFIYRYCCRLG